MLRTRMQWHQERQRLLAENVANADTPELPAARSGAAEIRPAAAGRRRSRSRAPSAAHLGGAPGGDAAFRSDSRSAASRCAPAGNAVNLEDEMIKVAANQMDYQAATALYTRSLGLHQDRHRQTLIGRGEDSWTS